MALHRTKKAPEDRVDPALRKLATILLLGAVAAILDATIVNVALDQLAGDLDTSISTIQWVSTGYLLALGMVIPLTGWSLARFGGRRMWLFALGTFLLGSVLSGVAWNAASLIGFRVLQGVGGGLLLPIMQTLLVRAVGRERIGRVMATVSLPALVAPICGPVVGGLIVADLSWRWIFFVNVPLLAAGFVLAWRGLPRDEPHPATVPRLDPVGLGLLSPALAASLFGLSRIGATGGFTAVGVLAPLGIGAALLAAFCWWTLRRSGHPVLDLRLFRSRAFSGSAALMFLFGLSIYGGMLLLPLFYQRVRGLDAVGAGLLLAPQGVGSLVVRGAVGRLTDRMGPRPVVVVGMLLAALGTVPFLFAGPGTSDLWLGAALLVRGAGLGAAGIPVMAAAYRDLAPERVADASSATRILQQVGASFGTAVLVAVLQRQIAGRSDPSALATGFDHTFGWALGFTLLALLPAALLPGRRRDAASAPGGGEARPAVSAPTGGSRG